MLPVAILHLVHGGFSSGQLPSYLNSGMAATGCLRHAYNGHYTILQLSLQSSTKLYY